MLAAQDAMGVQQGFPRDKNNFAPRSGLGLGRQRRSENGYSARPWESFTITRLLAIAFNSDIADAAQQQQGILTPQGGPGPTALLNADAGVPGHSRRFVTLQAPFPA